MIQVGFIILLCIVAVTLDPAPAPAPAYGPNHVPCLNNVEAVPNFNASQFAGIWYEVRNYFPTPGYDERCVAVKYTLKADGTFDGVFSCVYGNGTEVTTINFTVKSAGGPTEGKLVASRPGTPDQIYIVFIIVYDKFFASYTCTDGLSDVSIFARERTIEDAEYASAITVLAKYPTLKKNVLRVVDPKGCTNIV